MTIIIIAIVVLTTVAAILMNIADTKAEKAHADAMRPLWEDRAERRKAYPKAIISRNSPYCKA